MDAKKIPKKLSNKKYSNFLQFEIGFWKKLHIQHFQPSINLNSAFKPLQELVDLMGYDADSLLNIYKNPGQNPLYEQNLVKSVMKLRGKTEKKLKIKK